MQEINNRHTKRSQKDYSMSFKLSVENKIECGKTSVTGTKKWYSRRPNSSELAEKIWHL